MRTQVGTYDTGQISLDSDASSTVVRVRWPFDRQSDEWIVLAVQLDNSDIRGGQTDSFGTGPSNSLTLTNKDDHVILGVRGRNSVGPVQLDCDISAADASEIRRHLASV